jgi:hypothetical protein
MPTECSTSEYARYERRAVVNEVVLFQMKCSRYIAGPKSHLSRHPSISVMNPSWRTNQFSRKPAWHRAEAQHTDLKVETFQRNNHAIPHMTTKMVVFFHNASEDPYRTGTVLRGITVQVPGCLDCFQKRDACVMLLLGPGRNGITRNDGQHLV